MIPVILFVCYFFLLLYLFRRLTRKMDLELNDWQTTAIFTARILLGCLYGYVFLKYYGGDDTWMFFEDSLIEKTKLLHHPVRFIADLSPDSAFKEGNSFMEALGFYRRNLEYYSMVKMLSVFDLLSGGNYYIDLLFFEWLIIWGPILLFKWLNRSFPGNKNALLIILFFLPTLHFWLAGLRAEGLLLLFIAIILYHSNRWFIRRNTRDFVWLILALGGFFIFRSQYLFVFLPPFVAWTLCRSNPKKASNYFAAIYLACLVAFAASLWISPGKNLATPIIQRQQQFMQLSGKTRLPLDSLHPALSSFISVLPTAFSNTIIRPFITEAKGPLQIITSVEIMISWLLLILWLFYRLPNWKQTLGNPIILLFICYGITQLMLIGYTVPFPGAIVRYKSIPIQFLVVTIGLSMDWKRIYSIFK